MTVKKWGLMLGALGFGCVVVCGFLLVKRVYQERQQTYELIQFSYSAYPSYQKQVAILFKKNYGFEVDPKDFAIGLVDLNDDGIREIIAIAYSNRISGTNGCYTAVFCQSKYGFQLLWDKHLTYGCLGAKVHKTNGYHDIISFVAHNSFTNTRYVKYTLAWISKDGYEYLGTSEPMTQQEREYVDNEVL